MVCAWILPQVWQSRSHECIEMQTQTLARRARQIDSEASKRPLQTHRRSDDETHEAYTTKIDMLITYAIHAHTRAATSAWPSPCPSPPVAHYSVQRP